MRRQIAVSFDESLIVLIDKEAEGQGRSRSNMLEQILREYFRKEVIDAAIDGKIDARE